LLDGGGQGLFRAGWLLSGRYMPERVHRQLLDPRPAAIARQASAGVQRIRPVPGRMVAFPGWLPHSVQAIATGDSLRICIAWNVAYDKTWSQPL
jgi:hypothetical protein